jgi:hypothetical protein
MLLNQFYTKFRIDMSYSSATNGVFQQLTLIDLSKNLSNINQCVLFFFALSKKPSFICRIIIGLKTYCRPTFYGSQCSIQCIPNDDCTSSYTCNPITGEKICSSGWYGSECSNHHTTSTCLSTGKIKEL